MCKLFIVYNLFSLSGFPPKINSTVLHERQMVTISRCTRADVLGTIKMIYEGMLNPCICSQLRCPWLKEGIGAGARRSTSATGRLQKISCKTLKGLRLISLSKEGNHRISPCTENSDTKQQIKGSYFLFPIFYFLISNILLETTTSWSQTS